MMGRRQTETSYLKSVLLWLQEYWTGPALRVYPLRAVPQASRHYSARRTLRCTKSTRRNNRSARVLATPKLVRTLTANKSKSGRENNCPTDGALANAENGSLQSKAMHGHFALNEVSSTRKSPAHGLRGGLLPLEKVMAKEKTRGEELRDPFGFGEGAKVALEQTHQAMDTYFDFLKKSISAFPVRRN